MGKSARFGASLPGEVNPSASAGAPKARYLRLVFGAGALVSCCALVWSIDCSMAT